MLRLHRAPGWFGFTPAGGVWWVVAFLGVMLCIAFHVLAQSFAEPTSSIFAAWRADLILAMLLVVVGVAWALARARGRLPVSSGSCVWIMGLGVLLRVLITLGSGWWEGWPEGERAWAEAATETVAVGRTLGVVAFVLGLALLLAEAAYAWWLVRRDRRALLDT